MFAGVDQTSWGHRSSLIPTTWNSADKAAAIVLSNGDRTADWNGSNDISVRGAYGINIATETAYLEFTADNADGLTSRFGMANASAPVSGSNHSTNANSWMLVMSNGDIENTSEAGYGSGMVVGEVGMMAISDGKVWWGKSGVWFASGNPATGANPAFTGLTGSMFPYAFNGNGGSNNGEITINCGQVPFTYTPPAGFLPGWGEIA